MKRNAARLSYYKFLEPLTANDVGVTYIEARQVQALRQVRFNGKSYRASNVYYADSPLDLPSSAVDYAAAPGVVRISPSEFEQVWQAHLAARQPHWTEVKQTYPVGAVVMGVIKAFYPQGVVAYLGGEALGLANYQACKISTSPEFMYTGHKLSAVVRGYDERYQWLILANPQGHAA